MTKYELCEKIMLSGTDGFEGVMPGKMQKEIFGANLFGRRRVRISCEGQGSVFQRHGCWEGTHTSYAWEEMTFEQLSNR